MYINTLNIPTGKMQVLDFILAMTKSTSNDKVGQYFTLLQNSFACHNALNAEFIFSMKTGLLVVKKSLRCIQNSNTELKSLKERIEGAFFQLFCCCCTYRS